MAYQRTTWVDDTTYMSAENFNNIEDALDSLRKFPDAGGTATALTVAALHFTLTDGCLLNFTATADNGGAATTIAANAGAAKNAYKAGTTDAPVIKNTKMYTFRYDAGSDCFFIKAGATGDLTASQGLTGHTMSNSDDTDIACTMPNNAGDVAAVSAHSGGAGTIHVIPAAGYTDGSDDAAVVTDADFIAGNIKSGVNILGLAGTYLAYNAGNEILILLEGTKTETVSSSLVTVRDFTIPISGIYRICFTLVGTATIPCYGRIYKSDVAYGTNRTTDDTSVDYTEDLYFAAGEICRLKMSVDSGAGKSVTMSAMGIKVAEVFNITIY